MFKHSSALRIDLYFTAGLVILLPLQNLSISIIFCSLSSQTLLSIEAPFKCRLATGVWTLHIELWYRTKTLVCKDIFFNILFPEVYTKSIFWVLFKEACFYQVIVLSSLNTTVS